MAPRRWRIVWQLLKPLAVVLAVLVGSGLVLYAVGLRIVLDGGGSPRLRFVESEHAREERLARHREAQRAELTE